MELILKLFGIVEQPFFFRDCSFIGLLELFNACNVSKIRRNIFGKRVPEFRLTAKRPKLAVRPCGASWKSLTRS